MYYFYCDASALGKRYTLELGSAVMNHLFVSVTHDRLLMLTQALGETLSILVRKHNAGTLSRPSYDKASHAFRAELVAAGQVRLLPTEDALVFASLSLIEQHSVNSTDALVLASALDLTPGVKASGHSLVLVASDLRLLNASRAEGVAVFNPETETTAQLDALIAAP